MTLNITMVAPWGIWQSFDHRLTDPNTGRVVNDRSMKHISVRCPDGAALITYTGIGMVRRTHMSDWLRRLIRGESRTLDATLIRIREEASKRITPVARGQYHHMFCIGAFLAGQPWAVIISNVQPRRLGELAANRKFHTSARRVEDEPLLLVTGAGRRAISPQDMALLGEVVERRPRRPTDYHELLAGVNLRASCERNYGRFVSEGCTTVYMPPEGEPVDEKGHGPKAGEVAPSPDILFGIDLTEMEEVLTERAKEYFETGNVEKPDEYDRRLREAGERSVQPGDGRFS